MALITIDKYVIIAKVIIKAISIIFFKANPVNKQFPSLLSDIFKVYTADFVDLYLSKLLTFKPNPNSNNLGLLTLPSITYIDDVLPISQIDKTQAKMFFITEDEGLVIMHYTKDKDALYDRATLDPKFLQKIDIKIDDGKYNKGIFRTPADYEVSIVNGSKLEGCKFYIPEMSQ